MGKEEVHTGIWWGNLRKKKTLGRPRRRGEDNIEIDIFNVGWRHGLDRSGSEQGQVVGSCECGNEQSVSLKCGKFLD
jgi:hypothetical protein